MNGFRIWTAVDNRAFSHSKRRSGAASKTATLLCVLGLILWMSGCRKKTPTFDGPPDTVRQIVMKKWEILPNRLEIPQGARVELVVSSTDIEHGLAVPGLGINEPVQPEHPAVIRFLAQTPGTYPMRCSIACGRGHDQMTGEIVILPSGNEETGSR
ncbi:MAG: cupredoxin domain-containing protein [Acidobacteriota bacterium]